MLLFTCYDFPTRERESGLDGGGDDVDLWSDVRREITYRAVPVPDVVFGFCSLPFLHFSRQIVCGRRLTDCNNHHTEVEVLKPDPGVQWKSPTMLLAWNRDSELKSWHAAVGTKPALSESGSSPNLSGSYWTAPTETVKAFLLPPPMSITRIFSLRTSEDIFRIISTRRLVSPADVGLCVTRCLVVVLFKNISANKISCSSSVSVMWLSMT